ncbi:hypothetical protein DKG74_04375 [Zavarzinia aquatilis]|uniref:Uncharacterized protein n=1 Tax=Zavarzinia aquatilis TaxID=2211142 RepID=A0A317EDL0_9PROT|nr:hypothetical protein DKG74_04375 [Zavarzinia aquatilis]
MLHVLILLAILLKLPDEAQDGAGGMAIDIVYDVPGDATRGDGDDAAASAVPTAAEVTPVEPAPVPPAPAPPVVAEAPPVPEAPPPPPPEPVSKVPEPVVQKPPPPKPKAPTPPRPTVAAPARPAPAPPTPASLPGTGTGQVTTGEGRGTAAGAADPNAAAGEVAGDGGVVGNGVPRVARGKDVGTEELRNRLIGNTLSGQMGSRDGAAGRFDVTWQAYVKPDGTVIARIYYKAIGKKGAMEEKVVTERGVWSLENGRMCLKFEKIIDLGAKDCFRVQDVDKKMAFYYGECPFNSSDRCHSNRLGQFGEVLPGNAFGL